MDWGPGSGKSLSICRATIELQTQGLQAQQKKKKAESRTDLTSVIRARVPWRTQLTESTRTANRYQKGNPLRPSWRKVWRRPWRQVFSPLVPSSHRRRHSLGFLENPSIGRRPGWMTSGHVNRHCNPETRTADMASLALLLGLAFLQSGSWALTKRLYGLGSFFDFCLVSEGEMGE